MSCIQAAASEAFDATNDLVRIHNDVFVDGIFEGTTEIQANAVMAGLARRAKELPPEAATGSPRGT
jgi:hypothetical protein